MTPATEHSEVIQNPAAKTSFLKGFFNFDEFITVRLVKIVYVVGFILIVLGAIVSCALAVYVGLDLIISKSSWFPLFEHLLRPLFNMALSIIYYIVAGVLGLLLLRLYCEFIMVIFKINENLQAVRNRNGQL